MFITVVTAMATSLLTMILINSYVPSSILIFISLNAGVHLSVPLSCINFNLCARETFLNSCTRAS